MEERRRVGMAGHLEVGVGETTVTMVEVQGEVVEEDRTAKKRKLSPSYPQKLQGGVCWWWR